jgi:hypothetical protein
MLARFDATGFRGSPVSASADSTPDSHLPLPPQVPNPPSAGACPGGAPAGGACGRTTLIHGTKDGHLTAPRKGPHPRNWSHNPPARQPRLPTSWLQNSPTTGVKTDLHSHTGMHARLRATRQARTPRRRGPSVAVREKPTVRTDRPGGTGAVRYTSVDPATQRPAAPRDDTPRDKQETARIAADMQLAGRFRRWWQVLGSNQRRLSRRFYRPLPLATRATCLTPPDRDGTEKDSGTAGSRHTGSRGAAGVATWAAGWPARPACPGRSGR